MAKVGNFLLFGGSEVAINKHRGSPNLVGKVFLYDLAAKEIVAECRLPGYGNLYEIRITSAPDEGLAASRESLNAIRF